MRSLLFASLGCALIAGTVSAAEPIKPQANEEKFMQIPWMTNLWDARKLAAKEGKPILLWEMDGHPLSCV